MLVSLEKGHQNNKLTMKHQGQQESQMNNLCICDHQVSPVLLTI